MTPPILHNPVCSLLLLLLWSACVTAIYSKRDNYSLLIYYKNK